MNDVISGRVDILTKEGARDLTDQIRMDLEGVFELIMAAYQGRAWKSLGYASWDDYMMCEFGSLHLRPPREERQEVVRSLSEAGMSVRAIATATQLGRGSVERELKKIGVPDGTPEGSKKIQGRDGKAYQATRLVEPRKPRNQVTVEDAVFNDSLAGEDVLDLPASSSGVHPLDLTERAGASRERESRMLREFHGSGSAALPMTIKLASQVAGLVSPLTGESQVPVDRLHELAYDVSRGLRTLSHVAATLRESMAAGESEAAIRDNLRESVDELGRVLRQSETSS